MKKLALTSIMILLAVGTSTLSSVAATTCLRGQDIRDTNATDARTIMFHMRNGDVWRNTLQTPCPGLKFNGFAWNLHSTGSVCDNEQAIRVLQSHETCLLGKFAQVTTAKTR